MFASLAHKPENLFPGGRHILRAAWMPAERWSHINSSTSRFRWLNRSIGRINFRSHSQVQYSWKRSILRLTSDTETSCERSRMTQADAWWRLPYKSPELVRSWRERWAPTELCLDGRYQPGLYERTSLIRSDSIRGDITNYIHIGHFNYLCSNIWLLIEAIWFRIKNELLDTSRLLE